MTDITDRLDAYPLLAPDARAAVDAYVADHPEWADALAEAQALATILDRSSDDIRPIDVAEAVAGQALGQPMPPEIEAALAHDDALRTHADAVRERIDTLTEGAESPLAQFERLSGRTTSDKLPEAAPSANGAPARRAADRAPEPTVRPGRLRLAWQRPLAYAAALVLVAYGGLWAVSTTQTSDRARLADLGTLSEYEPLRLRGGEADDLDRRLDVVLDGIDDARRSVLGLFPRYDTDALDTVATDLEAIVSAAAPGSSIHDEARFALGRVRFYQGREAATRAALTPLVESGSPRAPDALRLLDALEAAD